MVKYNNRKIRRRNCIRKNEYKKYSVHTRVYVKIIESSEKEKQLIAKKVFDDTYHNDMKKKFSLLMDID